MSEQLFRFGAEIVKAEQNDEGDWIFEGIASLPGRDLQGEEVIPNGLEIDYLLGKGLPSGGGGWINYDHSPEILIGIPLEGKITPQGFWLKWKALKTKFMTEKVIPQMKALKEAGWPRRYGMSIEGVVKQYDPQDPTRILKAFIRNVALTPTPVHPGTFVDFAKSLAAGAMVEFRSHDARRFAIAQWARTMIDIRKGDLIVKSNNPYFHDTGEFRTDKDIQYFMDVHGLTEPQALWCARYALSRQSTIVKAMNGIERLQQKSRGHPHDIIRNHLKEYKTRHPECTHITNDGQINGDAKTAIRHFLFCEKRRMPEVEAVIHMMQSGGLLKKED